MGQIKFTDYVPLNLVGVNSVSKTLAADNVTGMPIATGARPGESFYLSAKNAAALSTPYFPIYPGWYRLVQVDPGATAANIVFGAIGGQANITAGGLLDNNVTDASNVLNLGIAPCVFLTGGLGRQGTTRLCKMLATRSCWSRQVRQFPWGASWFRQQRERWPWPGQFRTRCIRPSLASRKRR